MQDRDAHVPRLCWGQEGRVSTHTNPCCPHYRGWEEQAYLVDVGVPHLGQEAEGRWGVRVVDGELEACLGVGRKQQGSAKAGPVVTSALCVGRPVDSVREHINKDIKLGWTYHVRVTRKPACHSCPSKAWGQVHSRLPRALLGSPELILAPTLLLESVGTCLESSSEPIHGPRL